MTALQVPFRAPLAVLLALGVSGVALALPQDRLSGTVLLARDTKARLVISIESCDQPSQCTGYPDHVFLFYGPGLTNLDDELPLISQRASVEFSNRSLVLEAPEFSVPLVLTVDDQGTPPPAAGRTLVGVELVHLALEEPTTIEEIWDAVPLDFEGITGAMEAYPSVVDLLAECNDTLGAGTDCASGMEERAIGIQQCQSGGLGANTCEKRCNRLFGAYYTTCEVTCASGYYACCNCTSDGASCRCIPDWPSLWPRD